MESVCYKVSYISIQNPAHLIFSVSEVKYSDITNPYIIEDLEKYGISKAKYTNSPYSDSYYVNLHVANERIFINEFRETIVKKANEYATKIKLREFLN